MTPRVNLQNGTYTVAHPEHGHYTINIRTGGPGSTFKGKRIVSLLIGPNNTSDYKGFAFWDDAERRSVTWKPHRGQSRVPVLLYRWDKDWSKVEKKMAVLMSLALTDGEPWKSRGYTLHHQGTCVKCNRPLTTPESIESGIGPVCAGRV